MSDISMMVRIDKRGGRRRKDVRPIPDDFLEIAKVKCAYQIERHYKTSAKAVKRWVAETGISLSSGRKGRAVPENWEVLCAEKTIVELQRQFNVDRKVIRRWIAETEIEPVAFNRKGIVPVNRLPKNPFKLTGAPHKAIIRDKPRSIWDEAADVLRHYGPVYRCDERGRADQKGRYWRAGMVILTPDDLLARADRYMRRAA